MAGFRVEGNTSGNVAEVNSSNQLLVVLPTGSVPATVGGIRIFSENDPGTITGTPYLQSPETDADYQLRIAHQILYDNETFNYAAQNTGKHTYATSTMTITWSASGLTTNASGITTTNTGVSFGTYAEFPVFGSQSLYCEMELAFTNQPASNVTIDFGMFRRGAATAYVPGDGAFFRMNASGIIGVCTYNTAETTTSTFAFTYTNNERHQYIIVITQREVEFWIDNVLYGTLDTPAGQGQPFLSATLPMSVRQAHTGVAGAVIQAAMTNYSVSLGGALMTRPPGMTGNAVLGSYQGLSGGTMGSLALYANSANPTPAVPTNTTAALGSGLGGQVWETDTLAVTTDGIILSYQVPLGTIAVQGRRLRLTRVIIDSYVQTTLTGGGYNAQWSLAFGHTAVSLATAEAVAAKAPRRIALGSQSVTSGIAALALLARIDVDFSESPIYVNPGEFVAVVKKKVGTAPSAGVIAHNITYTYGWE